MTVAAPGKAEGILEKVIAEQARADGENEVTLLRSGGILAPNLQIGADLTSCVSAPSKLETQWPGVTPMAWASSSLEPKHCKRLGKTGHHHRNRKAYQRLSKR